MSGVKIIKIYHDGNSKIIFNHIGRIRNYSNFAANFGVIIKHV
jgi:hypothetical protein